MQIKAIKLSTESSSKENTNPFKKALDSAMYLFKDRVCWPVESFFSRTYERVSRSWAYARFGYKHYDFDSAYLYDLMSFKLKRLEKCLLNGHAIQEDEDMKKLKEAIKLLDRLFDEKYEQKYNALHDKKWGKLKFNRISKEQENGVFKVTFASSKRSKIKSKADEKQETKEFLEVYKTAEKDRQADLDKLNVFFKKTMPKLWD